MEQLWPKDVNSSGGAPVLQWTPAGLYCAAGGFHIDPHRPVPLALITHAHSDHARRGSQKYITVDSGVSLLKARLGKSITVESYPYRHPFQLCPTKVSFFPAGHILGSAQIRIEHQGEVWVASGDYKRDPDPSCEPFEAVPCDTFVTEATFGTPKFRWNKSATHGSDIIRWWETNQSQGFLSVLEAYSLGKTQRILAELKPFARRPVFIHDAAWDITACYQSLGVAMAEVRRLPKLPAEPTLFGEPDWSQELIIAPPRWIQTLQESGESLAPYRTAFASGWVDALPGESSPDPYRSVGFKMSDHADWDDLLQTIRETQARRVFVQHRSEGALVRHLRKTGIEAYSSDSLSIEKYKRLPQTNLSLFS